MSEKAEGVMTIPPATIAAITMIGVSLQDWVLMATLLWVVTQFGWFCYNRYQDFKKKSND